MDFLNLGNFDPLTFFPGIPANQAQQNNQTNANNPSNPPTNQIVPIGMRPSNLQVRIPTAPNASNANNNNPQQIQQPPPRFFQYDQNQTQPTGNPGAVPANSLMFPRIPVTSIAQISQMIRNQLSRQNNSNDNRNNNQNQNNPPQNVNPGFRNPISRVLNPVVPHVSRYRRRRRRRGRGGRCSGFQGGNNGMAFLDKKTQEDADQRLAERLQMQEYKKVGLQGVRGKSQHTRFGRSKGGSNENFKFDFGSSYQASPVRKIRYRGKKVYLERAGLKMSSQVGRKLREKQERRVRRRNLLREKELVKARKMNNFYAQFRLSNLKRLTRKIKSKDVSVADLLTGCHYDPGLIRELSGNRGFVTEGDTKRFEICFAIDCTGSMSKFLDILKANLKAVIAQLLSDIPEIRFSFITFGDYSDYDIYYLMRKMDFSNDPRTISRFIDKITLCGGGSAVQEAYELALVESVKLNWSKESDKYLLVVGDSVPYEKKLSPIGVDWRSIVRDKKIHLTKDVFVNVCSIQFGVMRSQQFGPPVRDTRFDYFYQNISQVRKLLDRIELTTIIQIFIALCYKNKDEDQLDDLLAKFRGLKISNDEVKKLHFEWQ